MPTLFPVGRSYASTDPAAGARFFQSVVPGTKVVSTNFSGGNPGCDVEISAVQLPQGAMTGGAGQIVYFVRDGVASDCGAPVKPFQELQTTAFVEQNAGKIKYDQWGDNVRRGRVEHEVSFALRLIATRSVVVGAARWLPPRVGVQLDCGRRRHVLHV